jgi:uroporphyrinogen decarboxylase
VATKRDIVMSLLDASKPQVTIPAAFFLHFDPQYHAGQAAVEKHLEFFRYTDMDLVKIQYERTYPRLPEIQTPDNWAKMPLYKADFYAPQIEAVAGLVRAAKDEAVIVVTLYSAFMLAGQAAGEDVVVRHLRDDPDKVKKGLEVITESMMIFVNACIEAGVDGFYASTQGGEKTRFGGSPLFTDAIKPFDLAVMNEIDARCPFNILHVCDYRAGYDDITPFADYPGDVVSFGLELAGEPVSPKRASALFGGRPYLGGLDRLGVIATGGADEVRAAVLDVLHDAPDRFMLGADCTVPSNTPWDNLRVAIQTAHEYR